MARLKALITIAVLAAGIYVGYRVVPAYYYNYEFQSALEHTALTESYSARSEADIQELVAAQAQELNIPVKAEQIRVQRNGTQLTISTEYTISIDIPFYPFEIRFLPSSGNRRL